MFCAVKNDGEVSGAESSGSGGKAHTFGWRDIFDIAIRWRQFSEVPPLPFGFAFELNVVRAWMEIHNLPS